MKLVFIIGSGAVGKMTVGQELMKITDLRLFHNHMTIEPVIEVFGYYDPQTIAELREVFFTRFAASNNYGMIFTYMWAFDQQSDWDYVAHIKEIFAPYNTDFYCVELIAPEEIRLKRNATANRRKHKPSKADEAFSRERIHAEKKYRLVSRDGEAPFENYLRLDNSNITASEAAQIIKKTFAL